MSELLSALDALAADDLHAQPAGTQLERIADLVRARNRLDALLARRVRTAELTQAAEHDGLKSMAWWLRGHLRLSASAARQIVRNGRTLEHLPAVAAACAEGMVTAEQVAVLAPVAKPKNLAAAAERGVDLTAVDAVLAETAATRQHAQLGGVVHHYLSRLDPDGTEPDPTEGRSLSIARHADGSRSFRGDLDAVGGEKFEAMLESFVQADRPAGDRRTRSQQLADALVQAADVALASGRLPTLRTVKPHVIVTIPLADLVDPFDAPGVARTGFGEDISAARARALACDGNVTRIVIGPEDQPMNLGRTHRVVPPSLRRAVELRDKHCVFAGCHAPAYWCDVHHLLEWMLHDGETSVENSALLCERHHTKVHHGFSVVRDTGGRWHTYRPDGTEILVHPLIV
ncbi:HNH endonuclease [Blastococcus sp. CT_GayMR19]|uniref:HNH endonuclease n=1 Tax=Blastococcus sp. CT_GayMR19 TaxID=2559608 RepID=UPI0010739433|nr:HNH endonuclease signature motif containing protein [Blastococcus sp. CT_GayMR19]TFV75407.1 HNH endonuclease [Blastococcus sp. CT_GayMR19]